MKSIVIKNARIVNEGCISEGDLRVADGRIAQVGGEISVQANDRVIDAGGKHLLPGMIDDQVHFREPGLTHKADMATESRAAAAGGITSYMEMPNTNPQTITVEALEAKYQLAAGRCMANHAFYMGTTNDNIDEIRKLKPDQTCGIKIFMGASTGNMLVDNPETLAMVFRDAPMLIATHCEDSPMIEQNEAIYREKYGEDVPIEYHPLIRSEEACYKSSSMAVAMAKEHGTRLHVLHMTTARELELFEPGPVLDKRITTEACVHHLYFDESDYARKGTLIKCNPAVKKASDKAGLRKALAEDRIDVIATDHAPHLLEEKDNSYFKAPAGLPLVQHALQMALELYHDGVLTLEQVVNKCSHAPAQLFGIKERGFLREGYWADLVLVDLDKPITIERQDILYKCGWSPLEGDTLGSTIDTTIVNGEIVYDQGVISNVIAGRRLEFTGR
ncbi:dihydroorotase [Solemya velum gill symbiont]|uniref:dihydroorotase n=1 Tax=Solemya velum gill symbiont TaxID=2340 RepID=UPI0009981352|nr:dihydroorotase [Solemya velum gill symbiont]OOY52861.1 dihydroorotase [Solemya velum gill symbiont]OOY56910.1 dihydroorotase [Solemya velum gill symbiont]OOY57979.1 dihydroorotase [Solemya velum gill symbiont]OOY60821.1 dihydroorotase [Solemya velum gill symbiont]OOY63349.1 dihydroorotase [Solemya velum gill symbiont]